jgi:hypothetical protein
MERDGGFMTLEGFSNKYNLNVNFIDFHGLINTVPREWRQTILNSTPFEEVNNKYINLLKSIEKATKYFYGILIEKITEKPLKSQNKWKLFLGKEVSEEEWENVDSSTFYLLNDTQLQSFQFKINHRIIFTNHLLMKCKLSETALCTFCNDAIEKIEHLFWECQYAKNIWISLASYLQKSLNFKLDIDPFVCMFNCYSGDLPQCVNICSLLVKKYLCACKIKNSLHTVEGYHTMLKNYKNVDLASCYLLPRQRQIR